MLNNSAFFKAVYKTKVKNTPIELKPITKPFTKEEKENPLLRYRRLDNNTDKSNEESKPYGHFNKSGRNNL